MLNYLRATDIEIGLLLKFGPAPQFGRLIFENERKKIRVHPRKSAEKKFADSVNKPKDEEC